MWWTKRENLRFLSFASLIALSLLIRSWEMVRICLYWIIILFVEGNIKRITPRSKMLYFIRITLYFGIYGIPVFIYSIREEENIIVIQDKKSIMLGVVIAFSVFLIWSFMNMRALRLLLSKESVANTKYVDRHVIIFQIYNLIGAAFFEELFFRKYLLSTDISPIIMLPCSTILFFLSHYSLPWGDSFGKKDMITQIGIGMCNGAIFLITKSAIPCILSHLCVNSVQIALLSLQFDRWHIRRQQYDKYLYGSVYKELDLKYK